MKILSIFGVLGALFVVPSTQQGPDDTKVADGQRVEFKCEAPWSVRPTTLEWWKEDTKIKLDDDPRLVLPTNGSLIIKNTNLNDNGIYKCMSKTSGKKDVNIGSARLTVTARGYVDLITQNYVTDSNKALADQIHWELTASYVYQAYGSYFGRADVALPGFQKFFNEASKEEREHAQKLIDYVNLRGGHVTYDTVTIQGACNRMVHKDIFGERTHACICQFAWTQTDNECTDDNLKDWKLENMWGLQAMEDALSLERFVNKKLLELHKKANENNDVHMSHLIEHEFLDEQVQSIRQLSGYVTRLRSFSANYALGEYMFDQKL